ncbi:MAG: hypothetical protein RBR97_17745 [Bacteroidales bacterium]|nr:hypothetical protein [Bacteroidales bacterium]
MVGEIIGVSIFFAICIAVIVGNIVMNQKSNQRKSDISFRLNLIRIGMTESQVTSILGKGTKIDFLASQRLELSYEKNERKGYLLRDQFMGSNPLYRVRVPEGYYCIYYGGETYHYSTNGYKQTDTKTFWGVALYFKNGILEYVN